MPKKRPFPYYCSVKSMNGRDRTDDQILAERDEIEKQLEAIRKHMHQQMQPLIDRQRALGSTKYERDNYNAFMGARATR